MVQMLGKSLNSAQIYTLITVLLFTRMKFNSRISASAQLSQTKPQCIVKLNYNIIILVVFLIRFYTHYRSPEWLQASGSARHQTI